MKIKSIALASSVLLLANCASIIEGSTDQIKLSTNPPSNSSCRLSNSRQTVNATAPSSVAIKKSKSDIDISCTDSQTGVTGQKRVESDVEAWDFGNILLGGIIGMSVDWITGAAYNYPDEAVVPMNPAAALPGTSYQQTPAYPTVTPNPSFARPTPLSPMPATQPSFNVTPAPTYVPGQ